MRREGEDAHDRNAVYDIKCAGQDHVLRDAISTLPLGQQRTALLQMLNLEARDPAIVLHRSMRGRVCHPGDGYTLYKEEIIAIIIQSRALSSHGRVMVEARRCSECSHTSRREGVPMPFIECAGVSDYDAVRTTCANCVWTGDLFTEVNGVFIRQGCNLHS